MPENTAEAKPRKKHRALKITAVSLAALLLLAVGGFLVYASDYYTAFEEVSAVYALPGITVNEQNGYIELVPDERTVDAGFVLYPGAKVDSAAYLGYLAGIAQQGIYCAVVKAPFHFAILAPSAAAPVIAQNPDIGTWAVGGHSLGGVVASGYALDHAEVCGLVLLASYPSKDLSDSALMVLNLTASEDAVLNRESFDTAQSKLPQGTLYVELSGGNHAGFGLYGPQSGDGKASLAPQLQNAEAADLTAVFLSALCT